MIEVHDLNVRFGGVLPIDGMTVTFEQGAGVYVPYYTAFQAAFFNVLSGSSSPPTAPSRPMARTCWP